MTENNNTTPEDKCLADARDLLVNAQYVNAIYAIGRIETDKGGLSISTIWHETEWLRKELLKTDRRMRPYMIDILYQKLKERYGERSVMCIMMLFALRLVTANHDQEQNPNRAVITAIVRLLSDKAKADTDLMADMKNLWKTIDKDGDENEKNGIIVKFGVDILADDADYAVELKRIIDHYIGLADAERLIDYGKSEAFDSIWSDLINDSVFQQEMRNSTLGQDFNLSLIFNVFGLLPMTFYTTKVRGAQSIARVVGDNPKARGQNKFYNKGYFNRADIEKMGGSSYSAIKTETLMNHIVETIKKYN